MTAISGHFKVTWPADARAFSRLPNSPRREKGLGTRLTASRRFLRRRRENYTVVLVVRLLWLIYEGHTAYQVPFRFFSPVVDLKPRQGWKLKTERNLDSIIANNNTTGFEISLSYVTRGKNEKTQHQHLWLWQTSFIDSFKFIYRYLMKVRLHV